MQQRTVIMRGCFCRKEFKDTKTVWLCEFISSTNTTVTTLCVCEECGIGDRIEFDLDEFLDYFLELDNKLFVLNVIYDNDKDKILEHFHDFYYEV